jgi:hypothetical protein
LAHDEVPLILVIGNTDPLRSASTALIGEATDRTETLYRVVLPITVERIRRVRLAEVPEGSTRKGATADPAAPRESVTVRATVQFPVVFAST